MEWHLAKSSPNNCQHHEKRRDFLWNWKKIKNEMRRKGKFPKVLFKSHSSKKIQWSEQRRWRWERWWWVSWICMYARITFDDTTLKFDKSRFSKSIKWMEKFHFFMLQIIFSYCVKLLFSVYSLCGDSLSSPVHL